MRRNRIQSFRSFWLAPVLLFSVGLGSALAQQRPPAAEDPKPIPDRTVEARLGMAWENRAVYSISGLEGEHIALFPASLAVGIGDRAEFKLSGTVHDYLKPSGGGAWRRDFGDVGMSAKILLFQESERRPTIALNNTILLPNANQASGIGLNTFRFFSSLLVGKTAGRTNFFGGIGTGILEDPVNAAAQQDVLTGNFSIRTSLSSRWSTLAEFNGMHNPRNPPAPGNDSRAEVRLGVRLHTTKLDWELSALGGLTRNDPRFGVAVTASRRFLLGK